MGHSIIKAYNPKADKFMRARAQTAAFEGGFVRLPSHAAWLDAYVLELTTFPQGKFDDQVDSTAQALAWIVIHGVEPGIIQYYWELAGGRGGTRS
jgi:predicted phage terminase large subunit-like protein